MRALIFLSLIAVMESAAAFGHSNSATLVVCEDQNGDYAEVSVELDTGEITVQDLASSQNYIRRWRDDLDSVYSFRTKGVEVRETVHSDKLLPLSDLNVARSIKLRLMVPQDIFTGGDVKMGIHNADEVIMTKGNDGYWNLEFGRAKHGLYDSYHHTIGKNCNIKIQSFYEAWPEKAPKHHKLPKTHGPVEADGAT